MAKGRRRVKTLNYAYFKIKKFSYIGSDCFVYFQSPVPPSSPTPPENMPPLCEDESPSSQEEEKKKEDSAQNLMSMNGGGNESHLQEQASPVASQPENKEDNSPLQYNNATHEDADC